MTNQWHRPVLVLGFLGFFKTHVLGWVLKPGNRFGGCFTLIYGIFVVEVASIQ